MNQKSSQSLKSPGDVQNYNVGPGPGPGSGKN